MMSQPNTDLPADQPDGFPVESDAAETSAASNSSQIAGDVLIYRDGDAVIRYEVLAVNGLIVVNPDQPHWLDTPEGQAWLEKDISER